MGWLKRLPWKKIGKTAAIVVGVPIAGVGSGANEEIVQTVAWLDEATLLLIQTVFSAFAAWLEQRRVKRNDAR